MDWFKKRTRAQGMLIMAGFAIAAVILLGVLGRGTTLRIDAQCRNSAFVDEDFQIWFVTDPELPAEWQNRGRVDVEFTRIDGQNPTIELDGLTFNVATRDELAPCIAWP